MSELAAKLLEQALKLSDQERMAFVAWLTASLASPETDAEWAEELSARAADVISGSERGFGMDETLAWAADPSRK